MNCPSLNGASSLDRTSIARSRLVAAIHFARKAGRTPTLPSPRKRGRVREGGRRELVIRQTPYLVPYRIRGECIEVLAVLHGRQRWPDTL